MARAEIRRSWPGLAAALTLFASPLIAQDIDARVVRASDSTGVVGALVRLVDASGAHVAQATTMAGGVVRLRAPAAGPYTVAVLRVGQRPWRSAALALEPGEARRATFLVPDELIVLDAIAVESRSRCRTSPAQGSAVVGLLEEADRALTVTRLAMARRDAGHVVELYQRMQTRGFETVDSIGMVMGDVTWPIRSIPPDSLAVHGFVREEIDADGERGQITYYGPDATVLLSPWFLATHCFEIREGPGADGDAVVLTFRPEGGERADISGRIVFARETLELRRIEWRYVRQPWWVTLDGAAGEVVLDRLPSGVYLPTRWWMRAPMARSNRHHEPTGVWGWKESGGRTVPTP